MREITKIIRKRYIYIERGRDKQRYNKEVNRYAYVETERERERERHTCMTINSQIGREYLPAPQK